MAGFAKAIQDNPSYATAYQRYSPYFMAMGRPEDSVEEINKARALDPLCWLAQRPRFHLHFTPTSALG